MPLDGLVSICVIICLLFMYSIYSYAFFWYALIIHSITFVLYQAILWLDKGYKCFSIIKLVDAFKQFQHPVIPIKTGMCRVIAGVCNTHLFRPGLGVSFLFFVFL